MSSMRYDTKVKLSLCLINEVYHTMKMYGGSGFVDPLSLTLAPDGGEWSHLFPVVQNITHQYVYLILVLMIMEA
jgi:hypothetical protein